MTVSLGTLKRRSKNNMSSCTRKVVRDTALELIERAYKEGIYVQITEGCRSNSRQNELYAQGRTKPGQIVTNARAGQSWHNYGIAVDFVLVSNNGQKALWTVNDKWRRAAQIGKNLDFEWGGDWTSFKDHPHLQMTGGLTLGQLQAGRRPTLKRHFNKSKWTAKKGKWTGGALKKGHKGKQVKQLQKKLYKAYPRYLSKKDIDKYYGDKTANAVKKFKSDNNMTANTDNVARSGVYKMLKKVLTVKQFNKAKKMNNKRKKEIKDLEKKLDSKLSVPKNTDVADKTHEDNWQAAEAHGLLNGQDAYGYVTRQQLATVMVKSLYSDAKSEEYAEEALKWAEDNDISNAERPAEVATRQQMITIVKRAFDLAKEDMEESVKEDKDDE